MPRVRTNRHAGLLVVVLGITGCSSAAPPPVAPAPPSRAAAAITTSPSAQPSPLAAQAQPSPSPSPPQALAGAPTLPPSRPRVPLRLSVNLDPPTPEVGQIFTLSLAITNEGSRPTDGVFVSTSGPWDRYTVLNIRPTGTFGRDASGWHVVGPLHVAAGDTQTLQIDARADEPSDEELTFAVRETDPGEVP